jgi:hypothetical protein
MGVRMLAIYTLPLGLLAAGALIPAIGFSRPGRTAATQNTAAKPRWPMSQPPATPPSTPEKP